MKSRIVKLISQYLINENLSEVSDALAKESKISLEPPYIKTLKQHLQEKKYSKGISFILPHLTKEEKEAIIPHIRLYQILEMVSAKDISSNKKKMKILKFIRKIQQHSYDKSDLLPKCAGLVFGIHTKGPLPIIPIQVTSQEALFLYIDNALSKSWNKKVQTVQSNQLITSLVELSRKSINSCLYHNCFNENINLMKQHNCPSSLVPTTKVLSIELINEEVVSIAMSHSHNKMAVLCKTNIVYLYNISLSNSELEIVFVTTLYIHLLQITSLMWNYDDTMLISSSQDKTIKILNEMGEVNKVDFLHMVSYSFLLPNNKIIVSTLDTYVYLYNLSLDIIEHTFPLSIVNEICWSEYLSIVIFSCSSLKEVIVYSDDLANEKRRIKVNDTIISISVSTVDKGKYLLINSSNKTPTILLYDLRNGELIRKFFGHRQNNLINKCRFGGAKDNFIIAGGNKKTCIWSINKSIPIYELDFNTGNVNDIIWPGIHPYNSFMISASSDNSITFISNKAISKFIYASKVNENNSDINNNNIYNNYTSINSPQSNYNHLYDVYSEYNRYDHYINLNVFQVRRNRNRDRSRSRGNEDNEGEGEGEVEEEEEEDNEDDNDNDEEDDDDEESSRTDSNNSNANLPHL